MMPAGHTVQTIMIQVVLSPAPGVGAGQVCRAGRPADRGSAGPSAAGVVHEAAGQWDAVSRAVARGKPVATSVVIPR